MKYIILIAFTLCGLFLSAQQLPDKRDIRIVDTLTQQEKNTRNPVLLKSELDSIFKLYLADQPKQIVKEPVRLETNAIPLYIPIAGIASLLIIAGLLYLLFRSNTKFNRRIVALQKQIASLEWIVQTGDKPATSTSGSRSKGNTLSSEKKAESLTATITRLEKENKELAASNVDFGSIKQEYEAVKQQMMDVYKIRNYPGFTKEKSETDIVLGLLNTERSVALYAYEHFLRPLIAIADANKNNPAKISDEEREKLVDLLLSLALLYSEYLYLRVNELSIGGKIVERIGGLKNGNEIDLKLLKELNMEHGSRALALRMALDKMGIQRLSYPVFEETNLNLS